MSRITHTTSTVEKEERGLFYLLRVNGDFSVKTLRNIRDALEEALQLGHIYIAFDLANTRFMDSAGTGLIANLHKRLAQQGGYVSLVSVPPCIRTTFDSTGLSKIIDIFESLQAAETAIG